MNMKKAIENVKNQVQAAAGQLAVTAFFIVLVSISQLFYPHIPNALYLNYLFVFSGVLLTAERVQCMHLKQKSVIVFLQVSFIALVYTVQLLTVNTFTGTVCISLIYLYCTGAGIAFFSTKDFTAECKRRLVHIFVAVLFFAAVYSVLYSIVFLLDAIFNLDMSFTDSIIFRIANAAATATALAVLACYRSKPVVHSKFFVLMFKTILPVLLLPFGVLCLIYLIKYIMAPSATDYPGLDFYYIIAGLFLIAVLMIQHFETRKTTVRILLGFLTVAPLLFIAIVVQARQITSGSWIRIGFSHEKEMLFHEVAVNVVLSIFFLYAFWKEKKITGHLYIPTALIALILFFPVFGFYHAAYFKPEEPIKQRNDLAAFILAKNKPSHRQREYWYYRYNGDRYTESETISQVIDTKGYSHILLDIQLELNQLPAVFIPSTAKAVYDRFSFSLDHEGKCVIITDTENNTAEKLDFYTRIKADSLADESEDGTKPDTDTSKPEKKEKSFIFENQAMKITVQQASYSEESNASIWFDAYIKERGSAKVFSELFQQQS